MNTIRWRLELFGSMRLLQEDQIICTFPPSRAGQLLAYLACNAGRTHTRQELAERIWPESDNSVARSRLRQHLATLRRQLEPDGVSPGSVLRTNRDEISLDTSSFTADICDFEDALKQAGRTSGSSEQAALLNRAVDLYRGELLSGYYEHWIQAERERLKELAIGALQQLASACEAANGCAQSIDYLQRLVATDPLREESHFTLIRVLIAAHKPAAARRQYKVLESVLKTELDAAPSVETQALIQSLVADERRSSSSSYDRRGAPNGHYAIAIDDAVLTDLPEPQSPLTDMSDREAEVLSLVPNGFVSVHMPRKTYRLAVLAGLGLLFLFTTGTVGWRLLARRDINPAHRNFSPAALKSGKTEETWIRRYETNPGDLDSEPTAIAVDRKGSIYVTGFINTVKTDVDYITMKYAPDGTLLWESRYNGPGNDVDRAYSIAVDPDGSVYVTGESYGLSGSGSERLRELDIATVKYDANGKELSVDRYDGPGHGRDCGASVQLDGKGHVYVLGNDWDGEPKDGHEGHRMVLIQYDKNLNRNWVRPYHDPNGGDAFCGAMTIDTDGFVYVTGSSTTGPVTLKYDELGNALWAQPTALPRDAVSSPRHIFRDDHDNLFVVSWVLQKTQDPPTERSAIQAIKYDLDGHVQWDHIYWEDTNAFRIAGACFGGGGIHITGYIWTPFRTAFLLGVGSDGKLIHLRTFSGSPRDDQNGNQLGFAIAADDRGFVHLTGQSHFADTEGLSYGIDSTEISTLTYDHGALLKMRRYAGSQYLNSLGGRAIAVDNKDSIVVAGQTFGGKTHDIVVIKYPR